MKKAKSPKQMSIRSQSVRPIITIIGANEVKRSFLQAASDATDVQNVMKDIGKVVAKSANPPVVSGQLAASVRYGAGKTKAIISAGGETTPYGPVIHYGWGARGIPANPFLMNALQRQSSNIYGKINIGIYQILKLANLK
jgi:hypothetical protein